MDCCSSNISKTRADIVECYSQGLMDFLSNGLKNRYVNPWFFHSTTQLIGKGLWYAWSVSAWIVFSWPSHLAGGGDTNKQGFRNFVENMCFFTLYSLLRFDVTVRKQQMLTT